MEKEKLYRIFDTMMYPFTYLSCLLFKKFRKIGINKGMNVFPKAKKMFMKKGVFPVIDHYYEPLFDTSILEKSLRLDRELPGIDFAIEKQIDMLGRFSYNDEIINIENSGKFSFDNTSYGPGDAEYLYNMVRELKPARIIEIGCGNSTLIIEEALKKNRLDESESVHRGNLCRHDCIEPYEAKWLEGYGINVIRKRLEDCDKSIFKELSENDILFIDSSHIIRPQGDVVLEYLEILPLLQKGVYIHIHDIFTPKDYPDRWLNDRVLFWNEQYLLEAFLSYNDKFEVIASLNYLKHNYYTQLKEKCPLLTEINEPGAFWIRRF